MSDYSYSLEGEWRADKCHGKATETEIVEDTKVIRNMVFKDNVPISYTDISNNPDEAWYKNGRPHMVLEASIEKKFEDQCDSPNVK